MTFTDQFLQEVEVVARRLDRQAIEQTAELLARVRSRGGRLFILGVGGSAGNASHAVNDFRKLCDIEAYTPVDNVSDVDSAHERRRLGHDFLCMSSDQPRQFERRGTRFLGRRRSRK